MCLAETSTRMSNLRCFPIVPPHPSPPSLIALSRVNTIIFENTFTNARVCVRVCVHVYATEIPLSSYHTHTLNRPIPIRIFVCFCIEFSPFFSLTRCKRKTKVNAWGRGEGGGGMWQAAVSVENYANDWANYVQKYAFLCQLTCDLLPFSPHHEADHYHTSKLPENNNNSIIIIEKFSSPDWVSPISVCCCPWQQISSIENFCK